MGAYLCGTLARERFVFAKMPSQFFNLDAHTWAERDFFPDHCSAPQLWASFEAHIWRTQLHFPINCYGGGGRALCLHPFVHVEIPSPSMFMGNFLQVEVFKSSCVANVLVLCERNKGSKWAIDILHGFLNRWSCLVTDHWSIHPNMLYSYRQGLPVLLL